MQQFWFNRLWKTLRACCKISNLAEFLNILPQKASTWQPRVDDLAMNEEFHNKAF